MSSPKVNPDLIYTAMTSAATPVGSFKKGDRLRGSHPTVQGAPLFWAEDGLSEDELEKIWKSRFPTAVHLPGAR